MKNFGCLVAYLYWGEREGKDGYFFFSIISFWMAFRFCLWCEAWGGRIRGKQNDGYGNEHGMKGMMLYDKVYELNANLKFSKWQNYSNFISFL